MIEVGETDIRRLIATDDTGTTFLVNRTVLRADVLTWTVTDTFQTKEGEEYEPVGSWSITDSTTETLSVVDRFRKWLCSKFGERA